MKRKREEVKIGLTRGRNLQLSTHDDEKRIITIRLEGKLFNGLASLCIRNQKPMNTEVVRAIENLLSEEYYVRPSSNEE